MSIQKWFCIVCLFFELYGDISNVFSTPSSELNDIDRKALAQKIEDLIEKFENGKNVESQVESSIMEEEELPDEVVMTQGHCTVLEYIKWWLIPGYQPEAVGTQTNPLIQHTFKRINTGDRSIPTYEATKISPNQAPYVKESSRYLSADQVEKLKKGADKIIQDIQASPKKVQLV